MTDSAQSSADYAHADIGIVSAVPMELAPFLKRCERVRKYSGADFVFRGGVYDGIRIVVVESGMGFARARRATQSLVDAHTPKWILSSGFCGGLLPNMKIGDIVMAGSVVDTHGHELSVDLDVPADPEHGLHVGRIVTTDSMVRLVEDKKALAEKYQAVAVDMESLAIAQICRDTKTRFLVVRSVSDDLSQDLPPEILTVVGSTATLRVGAALGALWKRPSSAKDLWNLREAAHLAAERLATFLDGVVTQLYKAFH